MAIFTAIAAALGGGAIVTAIAGAAKTLLISALATKAISKLTAKRDTGAPSGGDAGGRVQLPPATDNKLPIVYGSAWISGPIIDAKISTDQKYMWYCIALCEKPDNQSITFDTANGVYYGGKKVNFGTNGAVASLSTNSTPVQTDNRMANKIYIWLFQNGAANPGLNTGGLNAIQIMSDATTGGGIPASERWNGPIYTTGGQSVKLEDMAFAIVRVEYNPDAGTTSLDGIQIKVTNNMGSYNGCRPGTAILDYLTNERYGCAIPLENVDVASLNALNTYSNQYINYVDVNGNPAVQSYRYRVNGPLDTGNPCLTNLQFLVDTCDSWLQYTETTGKWRVVPNAPYVGSLNSLYNVNDSNVIGGIQINPIDLNDTFNQVEVAYPNTNVKDQTDYQIVDLTDPTTAWYANFNSVLSPNEAINRLNIALPLVNSAVQAKYLAVRRLLQSREDLVISCQLDYSGIQLEAGDVVRVNHNTYGWTNKLFRISAVSEIQSDDGSLSAQIEAFEYNGEIYDDNAIQDFIPADNTGLTDPNVISQPCPPEITVLDDIETPVIDAFRVETCVPDTGTVLYMDFNYGTDSNVQTHQLYRTVQAAGGQPFTNSDSANNIFNNISITVNDLPANTYYWSATARNDTAGRYSDGSAAYTWGGASIQPYNPDTTRGGLPGTSYRPGSIPANAIAGGVGSIAVQYSGNVIVPTVNTLNFRGGIVATNPSGSIANVTFAGTTEIPYGTYFYTIGDPVANIVTNPIDISSFGINIKTANFQIPKYIIGSSINVNYLWPWYQGTSDTANGYAANSTASFTPATAAVFNIQNGDNDYYVLDYSDYVYNGSSITANTIQIRGEYCFVADVDSTLQFVKFGTTTSNSTQIIGVTTNMDQIDILANTPTQYTFYDSVEGTTDGAGILIRNITAGSNVTAVTGAILVSRNVPPPALL